MNLVDVKFMPFDLVSNETSDPVTLTVTIPESGWLRSGSDTAIKIKAREHGSSDPYVDISGEGIDLSGYSEGTDVEFDFVAAAQSVSGMRRGVLSIVVAAEITPANWLA
jgi:hypothetical protein